MKWLKLKKTSFRRGLCCPPVSLVTDKHFDITIATLSDFPVFVDLLSSDGFNSAPTVKVSPSETYDLTYAMMPDGSTLKVRVLASSFARTVTMSFDGVQTVFDVPSGQEVLLLNLPKTQIDFSKPHQVTFTNVYLSTACKLPVPPRKEHNNLRSGGITLDLDQLVYGCETVIRFHRADGSAQYAEAPEPGTFTFHDPDFADHPLIVKGYVNIYPNRACPGDFNIYVNDSPPEFHAIPPGGGYYYYFNFSDFDLTKPVVIRLESVYY